MGEIFKSAEGIPSSGGGGGGVTVVGGATWTPNTGWNGNQVYTTTLTVTGALTTDVAFANINGDFASDIDTAVARVEEISCFVSSANTVTVRASITSFTTLSATASIKVVVLR